MKKRYTVHLRTLAVISVLAEDREQAERLAQAGLGLNVHSTTVAIACWEERQAATGQ